MFKSSEEERGSGLDPMLAAAQRKFHFLGRFTVYINVQSIEIISIVESSRMSPFSRPMNLGLA